MVTVEVLLRRLARDLSRSGAQWCVVGGLAVSARVEPRFTRDIDVAVAVANDDEAEQLVQDLQGIGYSLTTSLEQERTGRLAAVRLASGGDEDGPVVDLLFASSGIEPEVVQAAEAISIMDGLEAPVASIGHLIALKVLAFDDERPQDLADAKALAQRGGREALSTAREAAALIEVRGYARGRELVTAIDRL